MTGRLSVKHHGRGDATGSDTACDQQRHLFVGRGLTVRVRFWLIADVAVRLARETELIAEFAAAGFELLNQLQIPLGQRSHRSGSW